MANPRNTFFTVKDCGKARADGISTQAKKQGIFDAVGKIGDLEVLNDIGAGKIGEGLRTLSSVSDSIRDGENAGFVSSVLGSVKQSVESGANVVLGAVGINPNIVQQVANFNSGVANRGLGQAKQVFSKITDGDFNLSDIPDTLQDFQNLGQLAEKLFVGSAGKNSPEFKQVCDASPYANDLTGSFSPKYGFLFAIQIILNDGFTEDLNEHASGLVHVVKTSTRPTINFEYEEVNLYNFRTKFPKKSEYQPMSLTFYDDNANQGMQFYKKYYEILVPKSKINSVGTSNYENNGMNFNGGANEFSASLQPPHFGHKTIIKTIRLLHIYGDGKYMNVYNFHNPKILELKLSDLDMATSDVTEISLEFAYDAVEILTNNQGKPLSTHPSSNQGEYNLENLTGKHGQYNLKYVGDPEESTDNLGGPITDLSSTLEKPSLLSIPEIASAEGLTSLVLDDINRTISEVTNGIQLTVEQYSAAVFDQIDALETVASSTFGSLDLLNNALPNPFL